MLTPVTSSALCNTLNIPRQFREHGAAFRGCRCSIRNGHALKTCQVVGNSLKTFSERSRTFGRKCSVAQLRAGGMAFLSPAAQWMAPFQESATRRKPPASGKRQRPAREAVPQAISVGAVSRFARNRREGLDERLSCSMGLRASIDLPSQGIRKSSRSSCHVMWEFTRSFAFVPQVPDIASPWQRARFLPAVIGATGGPAASRRKTTRRRRVIPRR